MPALPENTDSCRISHRLETVPLFLKNRYAFNRKHSEKTVRGYVSNILSKLHLEDRTQVAVFAWQQGLMERG